MPSLLPPGLLPPGLLAGALPAAATPTTARASLPSGDNNNSFSRQLEQSRLRAQQDGQASPTRAATRPQGPPPPPAAARPPNKAPEAPRNEASRPDAQRATPPRGARQGPPAHRPDSTAAPTDGAAANDKAANDAKTVAGPNDGLATGSPLAVPTEPAPPATPPADSASAEATTPGHPSASWPPGALDASAWVATAGSTPDAVQGGTLVPDTLVGPSSASASSKPDPRDAARLGAAGGAEPGRWQHAQAAAALAEGRVAGGEGIASRTDETLALAATEHSQSGIDRSGAAAGLPGALGAATSIAARAGETAQASLATPATSPEFRAALGAQVSYLARAGVQEAELHLNPAELGPVSIQIVLDGQQAQVNFGADSALTRQIIESGMPELASALRDAGLTLTGGGVSQHAGGQRQDADGSGAARDGSANGGFDPAAADEPSPAHAAQIERSAARAARGGVDLYA
ncbi:MAG: hypothetical protein AD742_14100 [Methylibium sp. NZG]|nr:MAG: hypothetical protein AD742_14100 [Methylibium sp. NZG]